MRHLQLRRLLLIGALVLAACRPAPEPPAATPTAPPAPPRPSPSAGAPAAPTQTGAPGPAGPTRAPSAAPTETAATTVATPSPGGQSADAAAIVDLVRMMQQAVLARDGEGYLALVDLSDGVFATEHTRWVEDWARKHELARFALSVDEVQVSGNAATAEVHMTWALVDGAVGERTAAYPARFTRDAGAWRYAGEDWIAFEAEHFEVYALPGLEASARDILPLLPQIYDHATASLDYRPAGRMQIKLYDTSEALVANTLLSLPEIHGWNEPGEALKLWVDPAELPVAVGLAHEFTHFLVFEMAGTAHSRMPWWMDEGLAVYVAVHFEDPDVSAGRLERVRAWAAAGELVDWQRISDYETTPLELYRNVYPQGYAFVRYVTETYGVEQRNAWLRAMSREMGIEEASLAVLGRRFAELDADFRAWLAAP